MAGRRTGPDRRTVELVTKRAGGDCECCGMGAAEQIHHRKPRGMGGTRDPAINAASNLLFICAACHRDIESNRSSSMEFGHIVRNSGDSLSTAVYRRGVKSLLDDDGGWMICVSDP